MLITKHLQKLIQHITPKRFYNEDALITSHNHEFMYDASFQECYADGIATGDPNRNRHWRINILLWAARLALRQCSTVNDSFVEFGSNYGFAAAAILKNMEQLKTVVPFIAIDSFGGCDDRLMSEEEQRDTTLASRKAALTNGVYNTSAARCRENLRAFPSAQIIHGWLPDCLDQLPPKCNIRLLHIDLNCASAETTAFCCAVKLGVLRSGAIVVLDDYGYAGGGETYRAWNALAEKQRLDIVSLPTGQGMFIL